jgi:hypothetical protein
VPLLVKYKIALFVASVGALASVTPDRRQRTATIAVVTFCGH